MTQPLPGRRLKAEFMLIFVLIPPLLGLWKPHAWIYAFLWILAGIAYRHLRREGYSLREDWNAKGLDRHARTAIIKRFLPLAILLLLFTGIMVPDHLFSLPVQRPLVWLMVMVLYPALSVFPQELLFRAYFMRRYAPLFSERTKMLLANAFAFGWMHLVLMNWVAITFSALGGWLFADTYSKTKSLAAACFEHALYGCFVFTIGLGMYFYHGAAVH